MAWSDRDWVLDGAAVRMSIIGLDDGQDKERRLDGIPAKNINPDLTADVDITIAKPLVENADIAFMGITPTGKFVIENDKAQVILGTGNTDNQHMNRDVLHPYVNGMDLTRTSRGAWIIDFTGMTLGEASKYEAPMKVVIEQVKPFRDAHSTGKLRENWWLHEAQRPGMRQRLANIERYIATARVAKYRIFVWLDKNILPDSQIIAVTRDDDYFFGVLHSRLHEVWSLRMGTSLEDRPRYTPTTTFETFPFPAPPGREDISSAAYQAISAAAKQLHEERAAWLNPPGMSERALKDRTLTNLYNGLNAWRGIENMKIKPEAADFAPRLDALHQALDRAVCDAYGWTDMGGEDSAFNLYTPAGEEEILRRLLALNLARAAAQ